MQGGQDSSARSAGGPQPAGRPVEIALERAESKTFDLRSLPYVRPVEVERAEHEDPEITRTAIGTGANPLPEISTPSVPISNAPAPAPTAVYDGLDRFNFGGGSPPDTNGDVGPTYFIQTVNTSIGVYRKSDGVRQAAFTFNTFMSQGNFGNLCDTNNFGDPVVLYDTFEDRWIITDFAFLLDGSGNVVGPAYQCFAASKTGDPVTGGWNFYSTQVTDGLHDYEKLAIWPDGLYMSANMFSFGAGSAFMTARAWAFNKAQMYAGSPTVKVVTFDIPGGDFAVMPSNARLQTGTPPAGTPNYFISTWQFLNALTVYKFHVDWDRLSLSTFTGPDQPLAATSWPNASVANAAQPGTATLLDVLSIRAMVQHQYTNIGGTESLWIPHTVRRGNTSGFAAPRWYQANVTGGTVAANLVQAATWDPDAANVINRFMPSLALDRAGNMALGYSTSSGSAFPSIKYAGRLAADPVNTFSQTEQTFFTGTASQTGTTRWGDYSAMTLDPNGCTFWYTSEYANPADQTFDHRWLTKFGSIGAFPGCTPVGTGGTVTGTVTRTTGGAAIAGATVKLGARSTTTNGSGVYSFVSIPAGTYPTLSASVAGCATSTTSSIVVTDSGTATQNFSLATTAASGCFADTAEADFETGAGTGLDLLTTPGNVTLSNTPTVDQQNTAGTTTGTGFSTPSWTGQTFIPAITGPLVRAQVQLFCSACTGTLPDLTLSLRATSSGLPTGADLATSTISGAQFATGATLNVLATFASPAVVTSGTQYALILRPVSAPTGTGYFWIRSSPTTYANGSRVLSADSGGTWSADATRDYNFKTYIQTGYASSGTFFSGLKDANPATGTNPTWGTLSWTEAVSGSTAVAFQVAASNSPDGAFTFVGPDGTASTFFVTSGASLAQFDGRRYLQYKAVLTTTDPTQTPTLNDVTLCYVDAALAPAITGATTNEDTQSSSGLVITGGGSSATNYKITGIANGTLFKNNGTVVIFNNDFITLAEGNAGLKFTPATNLNSVASTFSVTAQAAQDGSGTGLSGGTTATISVTSIADTPSITSATTTKNVQTTSGLVISRNAADGTDVTHFQIAALVNGTLFKNNGTTPILVNDVITFGEGNAGLKFTPASGKASPGDSFSVSVQAATSAGGAGASGIATASITVVGPPAITTQPQSQSIKSGQAASLSVAATGAVSYQWYVGASGTTTTPAGGAGPFPSFAPTPTTTTSYWVRVSSGGGSADSDTATVTVINYQPFTDSTLVAGVTPLRAIHITELQTRINAQRQGLGLNAFAFSTLTANSTTIQVGHISELRASLAEAYAKAGMTLAAFTDPTLTTSTPIKRIHIQELRDALGALEIR